MKNPKLVLRLFLYDSALLLVALLAVFGYNAPVEVIGAIYLISVMC